MLTKILIAIAAIVLVFAVVVALQPSSFHVARSIRISAPTAEVFAQVNDFHKWEAWNPWGKIDPAMKQSHEGALPEPELSTLGPAITRSAKGA